MCGLLQKGKQAFSKCDLICKTQLNCRILLFVVFRSVRSWAVFIKSPFFLLLATVKFVKIYLFIAIKNEELYFICKEILNDLINTCMQLSNKWISLQTHTYTGFIIVSLVINNYIGLVNSKTAEGNFRQTGTSFEFPKVGDNSLVFIFSFYFATHY